MAWTALSFAFASNLTSTKMTQVYDNFAALAAGDSGAPSLQIEALGAPVYGSAGIVGGGVGALVLPRGWYVLAADSGTVMRIEVYDGTSWQGSSECGGLCYADGTNVRVRNVGVSGTHTLHYLKIG